MEKQLIVEKNTFKFDKKIKNFKKIQCCHLNEIT
jgi:hypothetical protein